MLPAGGTIHSFDFGGQTLAEYYGIAEGEVIEQLAFVFRNADGSVVGKTADDGDIFHDVSDGTFEVILTSPTASSGIESEGSTVDIVAQCTQEASLTLFVNGVSLFDTLGSSLSYELVAESDGDYLIEVVASIDDLTSTASASFFVLPENAPVVAPPAGLKDGINYIDENTVILQWTAPYKDFVFAIGDFNEWALNGSSLMNDTGDGETFWLELTDLNPGEDYRYQYHIFPDDIRVADAYAEVILDKWNDPWIPESTYPNIPPYPGNLTSGPVSVFTPGQQAFDWSDADFVRPDQENLVIYELLVRDFSEERTLKFIEDSLDYLQNLGVQALELMPVNEFNGNDSWGYNPTFYFAVDKAYGTKDDLKSLVDACHERGIAVILDVVYNHADQPNPFITMYWEDGIVLPYNPWFNSSAPHTFQWFYDWNHGSEYTREFVKRNLKFWVDEFHIDGFRWDFSQGIIQQQGVDAGYSQQRIDWLKEYGDHVWNDDPSVYMILEHWCDYNEEVALANYNGQNGNAAGFMLWANATHNYQEASMGYSDNNLSWANFESHNFEDRHAVAYAESHDEERLMYKNFEFGNSTGNYDASDEVIALRRQQLTMAFNVLMPGPRMLWQFQELGYDYSINTCTNGITISDECRIVAKPVRWDYYEDNERRHLHDVTGAFGRLKRDYPAFGTSATSFNVDVGGFGKRMHFEHPNGDAIVVGNYRTSAIDMVPGFTHTGTWYDYLTGEALEVNDLSSAMSFDPGEIHVYTDVLVDLPALTEIDQDLDGQLASEGDCNDNDANVYSGAEDFTQDGIDQDCDGMDGCVDVDQDGICDDIDECVGALDECGVCNGPGAVYECGCSDIPEEDCDCEGNQFDAIGVCGGDCEADVDQDGICDDIDECVGALDECGVCNGPGAVYECGCSDIPEEDCDCEGNQFDAIGVCGGDCEADVDQDGICDDADGIQGIDSSHGWKIYPNPTSNVLHLESTPNQAIHDIILFDSQGKRMAVRMTNSAVHHVRIDMSTLADGTYVLTWKQNGQALSTPVHKIEQ